MPVPSVSRSVLPWKPRPAPKVISARAAAAASLVSVTGQPVAFAKSSSPSQPMNFRWRFAEVRMREPWMTPGNPTPMDPRHLKCRATSATSFAIAVGVTRPGVSMRKRSATSRPVFVSTGAPLSAETPMSMPRIFMRRASWGVVRLVAMPGSIGPVRVAVLQLLRRRGPRRDHLDLEGQVHARQRMIGVERHVVAVDRHDGEDRRVTVLAGLELLTHLQLAAHRQRGAFHLLHLRGIMRAISLRGRHLHAQLRAGDGGPQARVEPVNDLA